MTRRILMTMVTSIGLAAMSGCGSDGPGKGAQRQQTAAYGSWRSEISASKLAEAAVGLSDVKVQHGRVHWRESRPAEGGRQVVLVLEDAGPRVLTDKQHSVRSRVHEYGGASYLRIDRDLVFVNFRDQRIYWQQPGNEAVALTPPGYQYIDCIHDAPRRRLICVREDHTEATVALNGEERNEIVALPFPPLDTTPQAGQLLVGGSDFVAWPRLSPDGRRLAFVSWNHPQMPWDATMLAVIELDGEGVGNKTVIAAEPRQAVLEPQWDRDGSLYFLNDPDGWWNLYRWRQGRTEAVAPMAREFGGPMWTHGSASYVLTGDGRAFVRSSLAGIDQLGLLDLESGTLQPFDLPFVAYSDLALLDAGTGVAIASSATESSALIRIDLASGQHRLLHRPSGERLDPALVSLGQAIEFPTAAAADGQPRTAHAFYYPPANPRFKGPAGSKPPLLVTIHGGPTSVARPTLSLARQYWTSRGFAVVDVNYGGSTSFGRAYRERLNGQWGVVDVQDAIAAVDHLVAQGLVDPERVAIRGGSAGGFTALAALAFSDRFKAGANYFGVADIQALAQTSHKFERNYDVSLIGPPDQNLYRARSPLFHLDGFTEPLITFQGAEDKIVPPAQSRAIVAALRARGVPTAYLEFPEEQHGFRKAENIIRAQEAELYFYGRVFGFTPADRIEAVEIHGGR